MAVLDNADITVNPTPQTGPTPQDAATIAARNTAAAAPPPTVPNPTAGALPDSITAKSNLPPAPRGNAPGQPVPKQSFREGMAAAVPSYVTDENGNVVPTSPVRLPSVSGVLGGVLLGSLQGALRGMAAPTEPGARGKGSAFASGSAAAEKGAIEADQRARNAAQQNFINRQTALDNKVRVQHELAQTAFLSQNMSFEKDLHPGLVRAKDLENERAELELGGVHQKLLEDGIKFKSDMAEMGIDPTSFTAHSPALTAQVPALVAGAVRPVHNGQSGVGSNGIDVYPTNVLTNTILTKPVTYTSYETLDPKTGKPLLDGKGNPVITLDKNGLPVGHDQILTPDGKITANDYLDAYFHNQAILIRAAQQVHNRMTLDDQNAKLAQTKAETNKTKADTNEANARTELTKTQTSQLKRQAANLATPDSTGFTSPLAIAEYNKRYDKFSGSKEFQTLQQMTGSYQQFQDTLNDINSGKDMTGAQSVVGLFNAIGISAAPLAGKGFRINSNTIQEHVGARGLDQAAYQKLLSLKNGDIITPQQIKDYASIAAKVYENSYVNEAVEAHRQGLPADFLPQGGGAKIDPTTINIFTRITMLTHPELAQDPTKLKAAAQATAQKNGWSL
jgi:hypothetical protein